MNQTSEFAVFQQNILFGTKSARLQRCLGAAGCRWRSAGISTVLVLARCLKPNWLQFLITFVIWAAGHLKIHTHSRKEFPECVCCSSKHTSSWAEVSSKWSWKYFK